MCEKCNELDARIAHLKELLVDLNDQAAVAILNLAIADLESEKTGLHPKPDK